MGVFDSDEFNVFHFLIFPLEGDSPWGFPGVRVDGVFWGSFESVVVKGGKAQEGFFIRLIENRETLEGFDRIEGAELVGFFPAEFLTKEQFLRGGVCEAPDHKRENTPISEPFKREISLLVFSLPYNSHPCLSVSIRGSNSFRP